jgi:hypothetical protein
MNLRAKVEELLPNWERWYPSLFDAASDLGIIKARVCDPGSLLLTNRHSDVRQQAEEAHREQWGVQTENESEADVRRIRFGRRLRNNRKK